MRLTCGPDHPDVAICLFGLALILQDLGQPEEARPLEERAQAIIKALPKFQANQ